MSSSEPKWEPSWGVSIFALALGFALSNLTTTNARFPAITTPRTTPTAIRPLSVLVKAGWAGQGTDDLGIGVVASKFCSASEKFIVS
jgi:hypothetical protein